MTLLDPSTIILMSALMGGAMSVVLFAADRSFPAEIRGLGHWAVGLLLLIAAAVLFNLRGVLPPALALLSANSMLLWGWAWLWSAPSASTTGRPAGAPSI
ncbi:hypothetical protein [Rugamonas sp. DEMB1]|uniref:hypothetical protein n=1 Tax=Rugamonas sp. DEMB1 TaxID=3039386 RepID=UPI00244C0F19|nr:hypothetical protein [Rugamonas sp. DEMB1]WGG49822.1 hypothetical protein QC826_25560 [Rugamonas sp. DEMB1]